MSVLFSPSAALVRLAKKSFGKMLNEFLKVARSRLQHSFKCQMSHWLVTVEVDLISLESFVSKNCFS